MNKIAFVILALTHPIMRLIKTSILLTSLTLAGGTFAQETANGLCPVRANSIVEFVDVYDGPFSEMAILMPDEINEAQGVWNLAYVYQAGRTVNIRCKYSDKINVDIHVTKILDKCHYNIAKNRDITIFCQ